MPASTAHRACRVAELPEGLSLLEVLAAAEADAPACLLESLAPPSRISRYTLLGLEPFLVFSAKGDASFAGPPGALARVPGAPFDALAALLARFQRPVPAPVDLPFLGGAMGYLGYELLHQLESVPALPRDDRPVPDAFFAFYDAVLAADAVSGRKWAIANGFGASPEEAARRAEARLADVLAKVRAWARRGGTQAPAPPPPPERGPRLTDAALARAGVRSATGRAAYLQAIARIHEHLRDGDLFQACLTHRLEAEYGGDGLSLYRALRRVNPSAFAAYLRLPGAEVISSSPERFLRLDRNGWAETRPIKGTRPRGRTPEEDARLREALVHSEKDLAENVMIADLARNDLGRVCDVGTVHVPELRAVEAHPFTFQMVSTVRGRLRAGLSPLELVRAAFPGGSMTGAPKVSAMRILAGLEPVRRGVYAGSLGYFDFDGSFDLDIVIRTFVKQGDALAFHVGGGIVADSDAEDEYQETLDKAHGLVRALELARAGA